MRTRFARVEEHAASRTTPGVLDAIRRVCEGVEAAERAVKKRHADGFAGRKAKTKTLAAVLGILVIGAGIWPAAAAGRSEPRTIVALRGRDDSGLDALVAAQQDPASPEYRRWMTGSEFGRRFGAAPRDLKRVERWLRASGCRVKRPAAREQVVCVGGSPGDVPAALRPLVDDVLDPATPLESALQPLARALRSAQRRLARQLLSVARRVRGLLRVRQPARCRHRRQRASTIGIVGAAGVASEDVVAFRDRFDLPPLALEQVGKPTAAPTMDAEFEAILDVSWAGAVAPGAGIVLAVSSGALVDAIAFLVDRAGRQRDQPLGRCSSRRPRPHRSSGTPAGSSARRRRAERRCSSRRVTSVLWSSSRRS